MAPLGRMLVILGLVLVAAGLVALFWDRLPLSRLPLGRLPGDILIDRPRLKIYFPIATSLVISIILTILLNIFRR